MMKYFQKLGKALMLPVAVLPAAAILMGIGYLIDPNVMAANADKAPIAVAVFLVKAGGAIIDNLPILFAVGVALGMTKKKDGAAALSGLVAYLVVTTILKSDNIALLLNIPVEEVAPAFSKIQNAFVGILSGLIAAGCFNKFGEVQLPTALSFFSGKRCVPIITSALMLVVSGILYFAWPPLYNVLVKFGESIVGLGPVGAGIYAFFNRLLIPTGLHHALNSVFWFDVAGINDIGNFWAGTGTKGITGMYQAGFFPVMMFGLPAGALAMYHTAKDNKKKIAAGLLIAAAFASFFTGVTEPLEFSFMFLAPGLYVIYALLYGIFTFVTTLVGFRAGFSFSAGATDLFFSAALPAAQKTYLIIPLGIAAFIVFYVVFRFAITKFDLKTPGREDDDDMEAEKSVVLANNNYTQVASIILEGLGGKENVKSLENCITRLRLEIKDQSAVDEKKIKSAGIAGVIRPGKNSIQVIVGTKVQFVADEMKKMLK